MPFPKHQSDSIPTNGSLIQPAAISERMVVIDVIRGVAVLGILAMNILSIGLPTGARLNPMIAGGFEGTNRLLWWVGYLFFDEKMIALFSLLFGAGLVIQADRSSQAQFSGAKLFYRRALVLLIFGTAHAYLVWDGDILVTYALCGMFAYPLHTLAPRVLIPLGALVMLGAVPPGLLISRVFVDAQKAAEKVEVLQRDGSIPTEAERTAAENWASILRTFRPSEKELSAEITKAREEGYFEHIWRKGPEALAVQTQLFVGAFLWLVGGRMLIGMALMKLGVLSGTRSQRFYLALALVGYSIGLPFVYLCGERLIACDFDPIAIFGGGLLFNSYAGMFVALGHIGLIVTVVKAGWIPGLVGRLASVGRMALTNYLLQSLICTTLFCGWGFGRIGQWDRTALYSLMLTIWVALLVYSPLWLALFRHGPAEWLWRTLSHGRFQPLFNR